MFCLKASPYAILLSIITIILSSALGEKGWRKKTQINQDTYNSAIIIIIFLQIPQIIWQQILHHGVSSTTNSLLQLFHNHFLINVRTWANTFTSGVLCHKTRSTSSSVKHLNIPQHYIIPFQQLPWICSHYTAKEQKDMHWLIHCVCGCIGMWAWILMFRSFNSICDKKILTNTYIDYNLINLILK